MVAALTEAGAGEASKAGGREGGENGPSLKERAFLGPWRYLAGR